MNETLMNPQSLGGEGLTDRDIDVLVSLYDGEVAALDAALADLFEELEGRGFLETAIVVVTSDHGEEFREHDGMLHGFTLYDESIRVPLIFGIPDDPGGRVIQRNVSLLDVAPTLLELLGRPRPGRFEGRSLVPWMRDESGDRGSEDVLAELLDESAINIRRHETALIREALKLTVDHKGVQEIYDLDQDPGERRANSRDLLEQASGLREALEARRSELAQRRNPEGEVRTLDPESLEALRALGYAVE